MNKTKNEEKSIKEVGFFHGQTSDGYRFTVAVVQDDAVIKASGALCDKKDTFCRKTGRTIAAGRIHKGVKTIVVSLTDDHAEDQSLSRVACTFGKRMREYTKHQFKRYFEMKMKHKK